MADTQHAIKITVDSSLAQAGLKALNASIRETARDLSGVANGASGFSRLAAQLNAASSSFQNLARSMASVSSASNRLGSLNSNGFSNLERGATRAGVAIHALGGSFGLTTQAAGLLATAIGGMSLAKFASDVQTTGNSLLSFKIGIDSVATSSKESGDALAYIRDAATRIGAPLDSATESFKQLYVNMRALGRNPDEIKKVFSGFQTALTSLHVSSADQKLFWREVAETYSQGVIHTRQAILSAGSHLPGMAALLQQSLGVNGEGLHALFKSGGLPLDTWTKAADILQQRYGSQLPEAFRHSQQNIVALQNSLTRLQQSVFENGFDSGFTTFLKSLQGAFNTIGIDDLGAKIGEAFRVGFTAASLFAQKVIELREPIVAVAKALAGYAIASTGIRLAAGAVALLMSPLGAAAALAALLSSQWDNLASVFSGSDASFNAGAAAIKRLTGGWIDLQKAIKGAVELWELAKGLFDGKSLTESKALAAQAGAQFDAGEYGREKGKQFGEGFTSTAATLFGKLGQTLKGALPSFDLTTFSKDWDKLYKESAPHDFVGAGDYQNNAARYSQVNNDLSESLKKVYERLSPANRSLLEYKENLQAIAKMRGKLSPITGKAIGDSEIASLTQSARDKALTEGFPVASRIQAMMDSIKLEQEALKNLNGNTAPEAMRQEKEFLTFKAEMLKKHVTLTGEEEQAIRSLIAAQAQLQKGGENGFSQWANSQKSAVDSLNDDIKSGLDSLADGIAKVATTGKGQFKSLGDAVKAEFRDILRGIASNLIRTGIKSLMSEGLKNLNLGSIFGTGMNDSIAKALGLGQGVIDKANGALDDAAKNLASTTTPLMNVEASVVNINGGIGGASGLSSFKPGSNIQDAIRPQGVGGIVAKNDNTSPLFSNPLPDFKGGAKVGGLTGIPADSVSMFGKGLVPSLGKLPEFGAKVASQTSAEITRNSVAEFGKLINLQRPLAPVAERAGVNAISGGSGNLATLAGREQYAWNFFKSKGYSDQDAAKILGNIKQESSFNPLSRNPNDAGPGLDSMGIAQWNRGRLTNLKAFAAQQGKPWSDLGTQLSFVDHEIQTTPYYRNALRNSRDAGQFGHAYEGFGDDSAGTRAAYGEHYLRRFGGKQAMGIDSTPTGSIGNLADQSKRAQQAIEQQVTSIKKVEEATKQASTVTQQMSQPLQSFDGGLSKVSQQLTAGVPATESFTSEIEKMIQKLMSGLGGGSGGFGGLASEGASLLGGLFSEGGYSDSAVSSAAMPASFWAGAPAYAEGTPNTSGGMPAILHPNEAVIPLSRGRSIPVEINSGGDNHTNTSNIVNVHLAGVNDFHSFRRSKGQIGSAMMQELSRLHIRNG